MSAKMLPYLTVFCFIFFCSIGHISSTERPLIGILAQETSATIRKHFPKSQSYISAAYVKSIEASGARVVPIFIGQPQSYYENIVKSLNGIVLPGGHTYFNNTDGYAASAKIIYNIIKQAKDIPVLGICLGFEVLLYLDCKNKDLSRFDCESFDQLLPVKFKGKPTQNKIFSKASNDIIQILTTQKSTYNNHMFCINDESLKKCEIENDWEIISTSTDSKGAEFISIAESTTLPIAALQFHPEKVYEWKSNKNYPHGPDDIKLNRYFFDWIVNLSRNNKNKFKSVEEELDSLISNYQTTFTIEKLIYDELYLFNKDDLTEMEEVVTSQHGCENLKMIEDEQKTEENTSESIRTNFVKTLSFFIWNLLLKYAIKYLLVKKKK